MSNARRIDFDLSQKGPDYCAIQEMVPRVRSLESAEVVGKNDGLAVAAAAAAREERRYHNGAHVVGAGWAEKGEGGKEEEGRLTW